MPHPIASGLSCSHIKISDFRYFGRKRLEVDEDWVENTDQLVIAGYSYWTLGYVLTLDGAKKLLSNALSHT